MLPWATGAPEREDERETEKGEERKGEERKGEERKGEKAAGESERDWENTGESLWGLLTGLGCSQEVGAGGS